jgi:hypothetical protein
MATIRPFKPVTGSTAVGRWIKSILTEAGVDPIFSAHSTSGAAASRAEKNGIPIDKQPTGLKKVPLQNSTKDKQ